jgi:aminopeptidase
LEIGTVTSDFDKKLDKYAEVIVKVGLNLQPGQRLLMGRPGHGVYGIPIELAPLVRLVATKAYDMGARLVEVIWNDDHLRLIRFQHAPRDTFEEFPTWRAYAAIEAVEQGDAVLGVSAEDPDLLAGQDVDLISKFTAANSKHMAPYFQGVARNATNWTLITAPVDGWVDKVLPDIPREERKARFWDTIFDICRVNNDDPISAWKDHVAEMAARSNYLNKRQYAALKLTAVGTDLTIGLPAGHIWTGTGMKSKAGIDFTANIPTEEVFTTPHSRKTDGVVSLSKPLIYGGAVIEGLRLTFSEGRVVEATAEKGEEYINKILKTDEGVGRLGEVALVPHSSPISQSGMLFYNTLIDENASSHIALGRAYRFGVEGGRTMTDEEFDSVGGNTSLLHIDSMIGSGDMDVDGLNPDGGSEPLMRNGEWVFEA